MNRSGNDFATRFKGKAANAGKATAIVTLGRGAGKFFNRKKSRA